VPFGNIAIVQTFTLVRAGWRWIGEALVLVNDMKIELRDLGNGE
jgi:hypothetical protein